MQFGNLKFGKFPGEYSPKFPTCHPYLSISATYIYLYVQFGFSKVEEPEEEKVEKELVGVDVERGLRTLLSDDDEDETEMVDARPSNESVGAGEAKTGRGDEHRGRLDALTDRNGPGG